MSFAASDCHWSAMWNHFSEMAVGRSGGICLVGESSFDLGPSQFESFLCEFVIATKRIFWRLVRWSIAQSRIIFQNLQGS